MIPMPELQTERLRLIALSLPQLRRLVNAPQQLEAELGCAVSGGMIRPAMSSAIGIKIARMKQADEADHAWYTWWLVILKAENRGVGLVGFKGGLNRYGEAEISYGIEPAAEGRGYATEAARALIGWAFRDPRCTAVTAQVSDKSNIASLRVLEKCRMRLVREDEEGSYWKVSRKEFRQQ
jgi:ribosomal-protein-alanine N-acetyltransferase